jgi:hypothetical protein
MITAVGVKGIPELGEAFKYLRMSEKIAVVSALKTGSNMFKDEWKTQIGKQGWKRPREAKIDPRSVPQHGYYDSIVAGNPIVTPTGEGYIEIYTDLQNRPGQGHEYPYYQEHGFVVKTREGLRQIPARPTMTPAFDNKVVEVEVTITRIIRESVLRTAAVDYAKYGKLGSAGIQKTVLTKFANLKGASGIALE